MFVGNSYLIDLSDRPAHELIGSKGRNLLALMEKGYKVPAAFCLTTRAYELFLTVNHLDGRILKAIDRPESSAEDRSAEIIRLFDTAEFPLHVKEEISNCQEFRDERLTWAVRSSSDLEDQPKASFAGQYDTYLNIKGLDAILNAVKRCWASLWTGRAITYREENAIGHASAQMAVIVQIMVEAEVAGVLFTRDPTQTGQGAMLVEYCHGLGDELVSGRLTPCSCRVDMKKATVHRISNPHCDMLSDREILTLSSIGALIERDFNVPQDVEWAYEGGSFHILQTRPISEVAQPSCGLDEVWTRANIAEVLPNVVTPLTWSIFKATLLNESIPSADREAEYDHTEKGSSSGVRRIQGRIYIRLRDFLSSFCYLPFVSPDVLKQVLGVDLPTEVQHYLPPRDLRVRLSQSLFLWNVLGLGRRLTTMAKSMPPLPTSDRFEELLLWNTRCFFIHLKCTAYSIGAFALLARYLRNWLPLEAEELLPKLLVGKEDLQTAAQGFSLKEMADSVRRHSLLHRRLLGEVSLQSDTHHIMALEGGAEFLEMFDRFLESNGARAAEEFELATPRWSEDTGFLLSVLKKFLESEETVDVHGRREGSLEREAIIVRINAKLNPGRKWIFTRVLSSYSEFCTLRENMKYRLMEGYGKLRRYFLLCASELAAIGILQESEDIFFLTYPEVQSLMNDRVVSQHLESAMKARRKSHELWKSQEAPPLLVGGDPVPHDSTVSELSGIGCSAGIVEGRARVLEDVSLAHLLNQGEILVAKHTDPGWTPLFLVAKGLVTEIGGFLSHGATVAREYGLPAVVSVHGATSRIRTGDMIQVDGGRGQVTILSHDIDNISEQPD